MNLHVLLKIEQIYICFSIIKCSFNMTLFIIESIISIIIVTYFWSFVSLTFHSIQTIFMLWKNFIFEFCSTIFRIIMLFDFEMRKSHSRIFISLIIISCVCIDARAFLLNIVVQAMFSFNLSISFLLIVCITKSSLFNCLMTLMFLIVILNFVIFSLMNFCIIRESFFFNDCFTSLFNRITIFVSLFKVNFMSLIEMTTMKK